MHVTNQDDIITAHKRSLGEGNIFSSVCQEFCTRGGSASVHAWIPPPGADTPLHSACWEIQSTSGRYASYWNAILLSLSFHVNDHWKKGLCWQIKTAWKLELASFFSRNWKDIVNLLLKLEQISNFKFWFGNKSLATMLMLQWPLLLNNKIEKYLIEKICWKICRKSSCWRNHYVWIDPNLFIRPWVYKDLTVFWGCR